MTNNAGRIDGDFGQLQMCELIFPKLISLSLCNMVLYTYADLVSNPTCLSEETIGFASGHTCAFFVYKVILILINNIVWSLLKGHQH